MGDAAAMTVTRNDDAGRYEIHVDGVLAGFTEIRPDHEGRIVMPHTSIEKDFTGQGIGGRLVGGALADIASRGETVVPVCPFVVKYAREHDIPGLTVHTREGDDTTAA
ncbi:GNAT family N-acetyltransferase [Microbacterium sp.]|uniref:GNAT family N-acetyltransferase n=1 Tax=Microbacterium sp. TaxID=51671 RepID=UPI003A8801CE